MATHQEWRQLTTWAGIGTARTIFDNDISCPRTFRLPVELRVLIYEFILQDSEHVPTICWRQGRTIAMRLNRPRVMSNLLLTCKSIYLDAICVPFTAQCFAIQFNPSFFQDEPCFNMEASERVLAMPSRIEVSLSLCRAQDFIKSLLKLQWILQSRQGNNHDSLVNISLDEANPKTKVALLRSLRTFIDGLRCEVLVSGLLDVREKEEENQRLEVVLERLEWQDISNSLLKLKF